MHKPDSRLFVSDSRSKYLWRSYLKIVRAKRWRAASKILFISTLLIAFAQLAIMNFELFYIASLSACLSFLSCGYFKDFERKTQNDYVAKWHYFLIEEIPIEQLDSDDKLPPMPLEIFNHFD